MDTIEKCPENLWENNTYASAYWRIVYHSLFYTALYLSESAESFIPWSGHIINYNCLGSLSNDNEPIIIDNSYSKGAMTDYAQSIYHSLDNVVTDLTNNSSGFGWLPMSRLELHLYNIRHLQHHVGQLIERLHQNGIKGINWIR
jgi:hypothetical protein